MSHETTAQPLREQPPRSTDDTKLVAEVLGTDVANEMITLIGGQAEEPSVASTELELSATEQATTSEAEKTIVELRHDEYIKWAKHFNKDEEWVDSNFSFNDDGTVILEVNLSLYEVSSADSLPPSLIETSGNFGIHGLKSANDLILPKRIGGSLYLNNIESINGVSFPESINGDVVLKDLKDGFIPKGCNIGGNVILNENQTSIIEDARQKGYKVKTVQNA